MLLVGWKLFPANHSQRHPQVVGTQHWATPEESTVDSLSKACPVSLGGEEEEHTARATPIRAGAATPPGLREGTAGALLRRCQGNLGCGEVSLG